MSSDQRKDTDTRSGIVIKEEHKWRHAQAQKLMEKLPIVVITRNNDEPTETPKDRKRPSRLNLARKTVSGRNMELEGEWSATPEGTTTESYELNNYSVEPGKNEGDSQELRLSPEKRTKSLIEYLRQKKSPAEH